MMKETTLWLVFLIYSVDSFGWHGQMFQRRFGSTVSEHKFTAHVIGSNGNELDEVTRRQVINSSLATALGYATTIFMPSKTTAIEGGFKVYEDKECNFKISVPSSWEKTVQQLPDRRKIVLFVDPASSVNDKTLMFIAYTPVRDDFTSLGSFGSVEQVGQMTILPKGAIAGAEDESKMLKAESKKNAYFFDYAVHPSGQSMTHFRSIFALSTTGTGGAGAVLVTLNVQTPESRYSEMFPVFEAIMDSYGKA